MSETPWREEIAPAVRTMQIIVANLVAGPTVFLVVVLFISAGGEPAQNGGAVPAMTCMALGFALLAALGRSIIPGQFVAGARKRIVQGTWRPPGGRSGASSLPDLIERAGEPRMLAAVFQTRTIVAGAFLEGAAFFNLIAYLLEQSWISLLMAVVLILGVAVLFPTRSAVIHWIEEQLDRIEQQRQFES